jgi:hypothetical protein
MLNRLHTSALTKLRQLFDKPPQVTSKGMEPRDTQRKQVQVEHVSYVVELCSTTLAVDWKSTIFAIPSNSAKISWGKHGEDRDNPWKIMGLPPFRTTLGPSCANRRLRILTSFQRQNVQSWISCSFQKQDTSTLHDIISLLYIYYKNIYDILYIYCIL